MINNNILLSKIVANPAQTSWAQAYSTLNLYIVLSIERGSEDGENIAIAGKALLEKLQREFFAQDQKNLLSIKEAVSRATQDVPQDITLSLILTTIIEDIAYIVIAREGVVLLKREGKMGNIASGNGEVTSFSGKLIHGDIIVLETQSFSKQILRPKLGTALQASEFLEIAESIAPLVHEHSTGAEAAIILQYNTHEERSQQIPFQEEEEEESASSENKKFAFIPHIPLPHFQFPQRIPKLSFDIRNKKTIIPLLIGLLVLVFVGGLIMERSNREKKIAEQKLEEIVTPSQKKYDEGVALAALNKSLAVENLSSIKEVLVSKRSEFKQNSDEQKKLDALIQKINASLAEYGGSTTASGQKVILDPASSSIKQVGPVTAKGGEIAVLDRDSGNGVLLSSDGVENASFETSAKGTTHITGDETNLYILTNSSVYQITKSSKKEKTIIENVSDAVAIDTFLGNVYLLNSQTKDIEKYVSGSFDKSTYIKSGEIENTPVSFSIDSSVWATDETGSILKFTKGNREDFTLRGLTKPFGKKLLIYTDADLPNLYILDTNNSRLVVLSKSGEYKSQVESGVLQNASSFAIDKSGKKAFIVSANKLISFDF